MCGAPFPGNRPKNTDEILQRLDKISRELDAPVPPPQPPQPPQSQRNLTTPPQPPTKRQQPSKPKRKWLVHGAGAVVLFVVLGGVQIYCQNVFNANPISLLTSLSFLKTTISGHSHPVDSVAFSPDGETLASGSWDNTIKIFDVLTGQEIRTLSGHSDNVFSVAFSPDGKTLASGSYDGTIKIWRVPR